MIIGIIAYLYFADTTNPEILEKEQIEENLKTYAGQDLNYTYVSSYIKHYGIGNIQSSKINTVEKLLEVDFYKELPAEYETARIVCELYLEYFYDTVDKNDQEAVTDAILACLVASTGDRYAYYRTAEEYEAYMSSIQGQDSFVGIGILVNSQTREIIMVYKDSGAEAAGIRRHDIIHSVEGITFEDTSSDELINMLRGDEGTTVNLTVKRGDELTNLTVMRKTFTEQTVYREIDEDNVGYIYVTQFLATTVDDFKEAVDYCVENNAEAIVVDVRSNPGGLVNSAVSMVDYLVPDAEGRRILYYTQGKNKYEYYTTDNHSVDLPIAILCNGGTASSAEIFTSAMRDFSEMGLVNAVIVGDTTYGKGIVQRSYPIIDGSAVTFTIGFFYTPNEVNFHGEGIEPDFKVEETTGEDAPFEKAKDELLKLVNSTDGAE